MSRLSRAIVDALFRLHRGRVSLRGDGLRATLGRTPGPRPGSDSRRSACPDREPTAPTASMVARSRGWPSLRGVDAFDQAQRSRRFAERPIPPRAHDGGRARDVHTVAGGHARRPRGSHRRRHLERQHQPGAPPGYGTRSQPWCSRSSVPFRCAAYPTRPVQSATRSRSRLDGCGAARTRSGDRSHRRHQAHPRPRCTCRNRAKRSTGNFSIGRRARRGSSSTPNIVTVFDVGHAVDDTPFIVMEFVEGKTLSEILESETLSFARAFQIAHDVLDGLAFAHSQGIVHRDIKPGNIMVTPDFRGKIMDFGIAHVVGSELTNKRRRLR